MTPTWFFKVMARSDLEQQMSEIRMSAIDGAADAEAPQTKEGLANGSSQGEPARLGSSTS